MKFLATKNTQKNAENQPDFNIYFKNEDGNIIEEEYTKKDGTKGTGWKKFGAIWHKVEDGKIKSSSIDFDIKALLKVDPELKKMTQVYEDYIIQQRNPGYPTPTEQGLSMQQMEKIFNGEVSPENKVVITPEMLDVSPSDIPF